MTNKGRLECFIKGKHDRNDTRPITRRLDRANLKNINSTFSSRQRRLSLFRIEFHRCSAFFFSSLSREVAYEEGREVGREGEKKWGRERERGRDGGRGGEQTLIKESGFGS